MEPGDKVRIKDKWGLLEGCEGTIIKKLDNNYMISLYKGNYRIPQALIEEHFVFLEERCLEKLIVDVVYLYDLD